MQGVRICVISGSRAEFGQLTPLLLKLNKDPFFKLDFVVTGSHLSEDNGNTITEIEEYPIDITARIPIKSIADNSRKGIAFQISEVIAAFADYFDSHRPDMLIVIGDRYEMYGAAIAASAFIIPMAHICGGSVTSGAVDEVYRHSITKMSILHFTTCDVYRRRVIQLGENPDFVYNVGSLAIENCLNMELLTEKELRTQLGMPLEKPYCVVTFHPVTLEQDDSEKELYELIHAFDMFPQYLYLITLSNTDSGGDKINRIWKEEGTGRDNFFVVSSLGMKRYLTALKHSAMMIGNSSSGTTEGPAMKIPVIDIGDRQKGRVFAKSILHCEPAEKEIAEAMERAGSAEFQAAAKKAKSPFGDGTTSEQMVSILKKVLSAPIKMKKEFYDVDFEVGE
ncbi:UDP-N-acetylglucosamine 2-epimerase [Candidatus Merdisoma sp. JLR.KK006]|uniref:UDP-N-acetylglucosamine 2-epimerase n=1 Tax=Candidatus Merdisoma sp. JLR.KK006 TaxID=3112626 RepID=UPI002FF0B3CC